MFFLGSENFIGLIYFQLSASVFSVVWVEKLKDVAALIAFKILRWVFKCFH